MNNSSDLSKIIEEIKSTVNQKSINKVDEIKVMRAMLNDPKFSIGVYDKNLGYIAQRYPREEAVEFVKGIIQSTTGLDSKDSRHLAENYEFSRKDAAFMINNARDFINVYMESGRKLNIMQNENTEASIFTKVINGGKKTIPDNNSGENRDIDVVPYIKLVSSSKCPRYKYKK